jgi:tight adherence protein C
MSPTVVFAIAALSLSLPLLVAASPSSSRRVKKRARKNLKLAMAPAAAPRDTDEPVAVTNGQPSLARRISPVGWVDRLERLYAAAGRPPNWPVDRLLAGKYLLATAAASLSLLYYLAAKSPLAALVGLGATALAFFLPDLLLKSNGQKRNEVIALELPDTLDQMTIAVEAGLGFDSAVSRTARNGTGPLSQELVRTLQDIQVGQSRRQAYEALAGRTDVVDLRRFIRAIIQADVNGIAIADVLRTQADEMRLKRRQRAEEKAMKIPVKVVMPLMFCILPVLFIVLMGPAAMDIVAAFS